MLTNVFKVSQQNHPRYLPKLRTLISVRPKDESGQGSESDLPPGGRTLKITTKTSNDHFTYFGFRADL